MFTTGWAAPRDERISSNGRGLLRLVQWQDRKKQNLGVGQAGRTAGSKRARDSHRKAVLIPVMRTHGHTGSLTYTDAGPVFAALAPELPVLRRQGYPR